MQIYKLTNKLNDKIYVGMESRCRNSYYGGGKLIKLAIKKYGK